MAEPESSPLPQTETQPNPPAISSLFVPPRDPGVMEEGLAVALTGGKSRTQTTQVTWELIPSFPVQLFELLFSLQSPMQEFPAWPSSSKPD